MINIFLIKILFISNIVFFLLLFPHWPIVIIPCLFSKRVNVHLHMSCSLLEGGLALLQAASCCPDESVFRK